MSFRCRESQIKNRVIQNKVNGLNLRVVRFMYARRNDAVN